MNLSKILTAWLFYLVLLGVGAGVGIVGTIYFERLKGWFVSSKKGVTEKSKKVPIKALGIIKPKDGIVEVGLATPDRIKTILVKQGEQVNPGEELAILESRDLRKAEKALAKTNYEAAKDTLEDTKKELAAQIEELEKRLEQLKEQGPLAEKIQRGNIDLLTQQQQQAENMLSRMRQAGTFTATEISKQELALTQATEGLKAAKLKLDELKQTNKQAIELTQLKLDVARDKQKRLDAEDPQTTPPSLAPLKAQQELIEEQMKHTALRAPGGKNRFTVLKIHAEAGETVGARGGTIFQLADTSSMIVEAEVFDTDIASLRDWYEANPQLPAKVVAQFSRGKERKKFTGTVGNIGNLVSRNSLFSRDPRQDIDRRVFPVTILLDPKYNKEAAKYINMEVEVTIADPDAKDEGSPSSDDKKPRG